MSRFGLQTEGVFEKEGDELEIKSIFRDLDAGRDLAATKYSVHSLAAAILVSDVNSCAIIHVDI